MLSCSWPDQEINKARTPSDFAMSADKFLPRDFCFTSIYINAGVASTPTAYQQPHIDKGTHPDIITASVSFGEFQGG